MRKELASVVELFLAVSVIGCQPKPNLTYNSLQGAPIEQAGSDNGIYGSKEEFLSRSRNSLPLSILLGRGEQWIVQIVYGSGWVPGAFLITTHGGETVCTPESEEKKAAYQRLFSEFKTGEPANRDLVKTIREGVQPNCESYFPEVILP